MDRSVLACIDAIHACHTTAEVNFVFLHIDACCLALLSTQTAVAAFVRINGRSKETES